MSNIKLVMVPNMGNNSYFALMKGKLHEGRLFFPLFSYEDGDKITLYSVFY